MFVNRSPTAHDASIVDGESSDVSVNVEALVSREGLVVWARQKKIFAIPELASERFEFWGSFFSNRPLAFVFGFRTYLLSEVTSVDVKFAFHDIEVKRVKLAYSFDADDHYAPPPHPIFEAISFKACSA